MTTDKNRKEISQDRSELIKHAINCYSIEVISFASKIIVGERILRFESTQAEKEECVSRMLMDAKALLESVTGLKELI